MKSIAFLCLLLASTTAVLFLDKEKYNQIQNHNVADSKVTPFFNSNSLNNRLHFRRDVSHIAQIHNTPPNKEYLPPAIVPLLPVVGDMSVSDDTEEVVAAMASASASSVSNEYLPPLQADVIDSTSAPITEGPSKNKAIDLLLDASDIENEVIEEQDTAILTEDGYYYKRPIVEFLPPLKDASFSQTTPSIEKSTDLENE